MLKTDMEVLFSKGVRTRDQVLLHVDKIMAKSNSNFLMKAGTTASGWNGRLKAWEVVY
jgi:hypothetical protein